MKKETKVNCKVESCKHNEEKKCSLEELDISCTCDGEDCEEIEETICNNFEKCDDDDICEELEYDDLDEEEHEEFEEDKELDEEDDSEYYDDKIEEYDDDKIEEDDDEYYEEEITDTYIELEEKEEL